MPRPDPDDPKPTMAVPRRYRRRSRLRRIPGYARRAGSLPADWDRVDSLAALPDLRPLGQLHDSFIIAAGRDGLWIIDQHVAHERILFEQVLRQRAQGQSRFSNC